MRTLSAPFLLSSLVATAAMAAIDYETFDEFVPIVGINASDGDIGFHVLLDGET